MKSNQQKRYLVMRGQKAVLDLQVPPVVPGSMWQHFAEGTWESWVSAASGILCSQSIL